jgi:drug/metabolite transporter (DMT)-like permease
MSAQASSFIALMIPFGALAFGALLYDEAITGRALAGAALVVAGLVAARGRPPARVRRRRAGDPEPAPEQVAA